MQLTHSSIRCWFVVTVLWCAGATPTLAQGQWASQPVDQGDLLDTRFIAVPSTWWHGELLIEVSAAQGTLGEWRFTLVDQEDHALDVTSGTNPERIEARDGGRRARLNVPIGAWSTIKAVPRTVGLSVKAITVFFPQKENSQQWLYGVKPDTFDAAVGPTEQAVGQGFGELKIYDASGRRIATCTAFRIRRGYWLTAAHCATRDPARSDVAYAYVQPNDYVGSSPSGLGMRANFIASGQVGGRWDPTSPIKITDADYALLEVPADAGGPEFALSNVPYGKDTPLEVFMHWPNAPIGKARSQGPQCVIKSVIGTTSSTLPWLCFNAMQHGCTTDEGASGSAVVTLAAPHQLVGLHYSAGKSDAYNCALPASAIQKHLCESNPMLAGKVTQCPIH